MDVRDKLVRAAETGAQGNKAKSHSSVRTERPPKISDDIRNKVINAVEGGMTCRQAAADCGVSLASAIRFAKSAGATDRRANAKRNVRDKMLRAIEGGMSCCEAAAHYGLSPTTAVKWAKKAGISLKHTPPNKISADIRDKVLKAVEGGMTCRQAAALCGVSLASAIRFAKWAGVTDKRAKAERNVRDKVLKAVEKGMSCREAAAQFGVSPSATMKWAVKAGIRHKPASSGRISDEIRDKVLKAVESGMSCRQAAAHCRVSLASAIRWTKHLRT
jgi:transposase